MFKSLGRGGIRRASGRGGQTSRVSGLTSLRGRNIEDEQRRRPAFLPATPQEQVRDYQGPRVSGLE
jgi:hypothetical protein